MTSGALYVSFWHIRLANLPTGRFVRRELSASEAGEIIAEARTARHLVCASAVDLLAPSGKAERKRYEELCSVLREQCEVAIGIEDFLGCPESSDPDLAFPQPLKFIKLDSLGRLLVVDCLYQMDHTMRAGVERRVGFTVANDSVSFSLIEILAADKSGSISSGN